MKPAATPATPSLMTLLCIIGEVMRGEASAALAMSFLVIGVTVPEFGWLIKTWLRMEEYAAAGHVWLGEPESEPEPEMERGDEHEAGLRSGWVRQDGPVWLWRHVTRVGAVIIPIRWFGTFRIAEFLPRGRAWAPAWSIPVTFQNFIFSLDMAAGRNCDHFVPVS